MAYTLWSVVYGEQPTAAKWNQLGANDAGFKDGTNIDNLAILTRHLAASAVTAPKIDATTLEATRVRTVGGEDTFTTGAYKSSSITLLANVTYLIIAEVLWHSTGGGNKAISLRFNGSSLDPHRSECTLQTPFAAMGLARVTTDTTGNLDLFASNVVGSATGTLGPTTYTIIPLLTKAAIA